MARVFITGSSDGLGLMAARLLIEEGHSVIAHARGGQRAGETRTALPGAEHVVTGDLSSIAQTRGVADQVNALGDVDAVIYNAAVGPDERRRSRRPTGCRTSSRSTCSRPISSRRSSRARGAWST